MKLRGEVGGKSQSFEDLLQEIAQYKSRSRLLKTIYSTGHYTNGVMLTRLTQRESDLITCKHLDATISDSEYRDCTPFDILERAVPKYLRIECTSISIPRKTKEKDSKVKVVVLEGNGVQVFVEECPFFQFYKRLEQLLPGSILEKDTSWWLSRKNCPIAVLDNRGFSKGRLLGTIAQIPISRKEDFDYGEPLLKRFHKKGIGWMYKLIGEEDASK